MKNYYKLNEENYPMTYQGKAPLDDTWKEFEVATDEVTGISLYYPVELNDAMVALEIKEANDTQLAKAKSYLSDTDWVVVKINEVAITGGDTAPLLDKYADILLERENKRLTINQLEANI